MALAWVKVDGIYLAAPADPVVLTGVVADHSVTVGFQPVVLNVSLGAGWNLVAGGPGSGPAGLQLFYFTTSGYDFSAPENMVAGRGYWVRFTAPGSMQLKTTTLPLSIHLEKGWNLIGNSSGLTVPVPAGLMAFIWSGGYSIATTLAPGQAAWIYVSIPEDIILTVS
jgi:hypothetical protein